MDIINALVIDDEDDARRFLVSCLQQQGGLAVAEAASAESALALLESFKPELIIADVNLPGINGYELCRRVRLMGHDDIPFVFCSTLGGLPERIKGLRVGGDGYLVKPVAAEELLLQVRLHLERSRRIRELQASASSQPDGTISGTLGEVSVAELLQLMDMRGRGEICLEIDGPHVAEIYTNDRALVHASAGELTGPKALLRILTWTDGPFRVTARSWLGEPSLDDRIDHALFEATAELDDVAHLRERLGGEEAVEIAHGPHIFSRALPDETVAVLRLVETHGRVDAILDASPLTDRDTLRMLIELMEEGYVVPTKPPDVPPGKRASSRERTAIAEAAAAASPLGENWQDTLRELRKHYVAGAAERLTEIAAGIADLQGDPASSDALQRVLRGFHAFAGSGTTYGFPSVSAHGLDAERRCLELVRSGTVPQEVDITALATHLDAISALFSEGAAQPALAIPTPEPPPPRELLLVSPDADDTAPLQRALRAEGWDVTTIPSTKTALGAARSRMPDGLIVDDQFPDGAGFDLIRRVRDLPGGEDVAVIVLRTPGEFLDKVEAVHAGADGVLEKPIHEPEAIRGLRRLIERNAAPPGRVLAVEDDRVQAAFYETVLRAAGYAVRVCSEPRRLEAELADFQPDLVLMDVVLPGSDGFGLVRYIRQDERWTTLPVLFVTTQAQTRARLEAMRSGGDDFLVKPVLAWLLVPAVAARIERARLLKSLIDHDGLTRLLVHTAFLDRAQRLVSQAVRSPERSLAMVMIDIDGLREINAEHGHLTGDRVLSGCAALLRRRLRHSDLLGRYSGDEIAFVLDDLESQDAVRLVLRLRDEFAALDHVADGGRTVRATFSAGIAMLDAANMDLTRWLQAAEAALDGARRTGPSALRLAGAGPTPVPRPRAAAGGGAQTSSDASVMPSKRNVDR